MGYKIREIRVVELEIDFKTNRSDAEALLARAFKEADFPSVTGEFLQSVKDQETGYYLLDVRGRLVWSCGIETRDRATDLWKAFVKTTLFSGYSTEKLNFSEDGKSASFGVDTLRPNGAIINHDSVCL